MFFTENQIKDKTTCGKCKTIFNDPRSLPCGECICNKCILNGIGDKSSNEFNCFCCDEIHNVPRNGFPVNKIVLSFLEMKPQAEIKFNVWEEFKKQLKQMKGNLDNLISKVNSSDEIVTEHCEMVKNQIDTKTESLIQKIESYREVLLKEVDDYELECKDNIKKAKINFEKKMKESCRLFDEYNEYLNKQIIDENVLAQMNKNAIKQTKSLEGKLNKFNVVIFNNNKIKFNECIQDDIDSSLIGKMVYQLVNSFDLTKYSNTIDLKSKITSFSYIESTFILQNGNIVIVYINTSNKYNICVFDQKHTLRKTTLASSLFNDCIFEPFFYGLRNQILVNYYNKNGSHQLLSMDQDLVVQKNVTCRGIYSKFCGNSEKIIGLHNGKLDIYNSNLEILQTVGQTDIDLLPFYIDPSNITEILLLNNNFILRSSNNITLMNIESGFQEASIDIKNHQVITKDNRIYVVASNNKGKFELKVYNSNGELKYDYALIGFTTDCLLSLNEYKIDFSLNKRNLLVNYY
jgi:hypothetical protein